MNRLFNVGAPRLDAMLDSETLRVLEEAGDDRAFADGTILFERGLEPAPLVYIRSGRVEIGDHDLSGAFLIGSRLGEGYCFGEAALLSAMPSGVAARASGETRVRWIDAGAYAAMVAQHPAIGEAVTRVLAIRYRLLSELVDDLRRHPLNIQLARTLLAVAGNRANDPRVNVGVRELSTMLGAADVAVSAGIARLERDGLVRRLGNVVEVPDRAVLHSWIQRRVSRIVPTEPERPRGPTQTFRQRRGG
ncbi:MAG: Crp/Fnr family transcriptional regulator [Pseudomonadota bacterium]